MPVPDWKLARKPTVIRLTPGDCAVTGTCRNWRWRLAGDFRLRNGIQHRTRQRSRYAGFVTLDARDYSTAALGHVAELHDIGLRLFALLRKARALRCTAQARNRRVAYPTAVNVTLENGNVIAERQRARWRLTTLHALASSLQR